AYGWPTTLTDAEILERLVALNAERAAEEKRGIIHWLRPDYQIKALGLTAQLSVLTPGELDLPEPKKKPKRQTQSSVLSPQSSKRKQDWPKTLSARVQAIEAALHRAASPVSADDLAKQFTRAKSTDIHEILETLATMGRAHRKGANYTK
ncbi:MAG TPA: class I SAM-dependent DNA methyltransferase, partial [Verrucomicrobiae bacterium]